MAFVLALYSFASAQDMKGMDMSKTAKSKKVQKKKTPVKAAKKSSEMKNMKMPVNDNKKDSSMKEMKMNGMKKPAQPSVGDSTKNMKMNDMNGMNMDTSVTDKKMENSDEMIADKLIADKLNLLPGRTVRYDLYVRDTIVNFTGKRKHAIAINGQIPAPTLTFTEGDTAEIYLHNDLKKEETSLHWHGVILPNRFDGLPFLTTARIGPGETHLYKFRIVQNGTYWYHSHTGLQEQAGMYGALIFKKREVPAAEGEAKEYTIVLSEWTNERPAEVQRRLLAGNDWYAIKKGSTQSYAEAIKQGYFKTKLINEWKRMKAMDVSDVYYDRFLINGKPENDVSEFKAGDKVKLRIVNAGSSSYFWLQFAGGKLTVVANDGNDVEPIEVDRMIIAPAETYDVIVTIPQNMSYEFKATPEDRTKSTSLWLGTGMKMPAPVLPKLKYFEGMKMMNDMMKTNGQMKMMEGMDMSLQQMDMNTVMYPEITGSGKSNGMDMNNMKADNTKSASTQGTNKDEKKNKDNMPGMNMTPSSSEVTGGDIVTLNYTMLRAPVKTTLPDLPIKVLHFNLTGNMNRYVWTLNNKIVTEANRILIKQGENVRIILTNLSMMRHPMHLHGHDFRVLNGQGEYAPLKNVIDIMPMETDTIEFVANQSGNWFFHCHILYHMMAGMGRVFTYENSPVNPELPDAAKAYRDFKKDNRMIHPMARIGLESNGVDGMAMLSTTRYELQQMWHLGYQDAHGYESETNFGRYLDKNQWLFTYVGFDYHYMKDSMSSNNIFGNEKYNLLGQLSDKNNRHTFVAGIQYTLPMLIVADTRIDGNGKFRFQLSREDVPISPRLRFNFMVNTDKEYAAGLRYIITKWFSLSTHYDSDMGLGAGVTLTY